MLLWEDMAMKDQFTQLTQFTEEIGDTLFAIAMAVAIGIGAANLAVQVSKERAALDAAIATPEAVSTLTLPGDAGPAG
jgi:hypothetical protein